MRLSLRGGSKTRSLSLLSCSLPQYGAFYHGGETVYVRDSWLNHRIDWISKDRQRGCSHLTDDYLLSSQWACLAWFITRGLVSVIHTNTSPIALAFHYGCNRQRRYRSVYSVTHASKIDTSDLTSIAYLLHTRWFSMNGMLGSEVSGHLNIKEFKGSLSSLMAS